MVVVAAGGVAVGSGGGLSKYGVGKEKEVLLHGSKRTKE